MGAGIAGEFGRAGCEVRLVDRDADALDRGMEMLRKAQESLVKAKFVTAENADMALERIRPVTTIEEAGPFTLAEDYHHRITHIGGI